MVRDLTFFALFSRPVCPSGDGGVLESCCFSSPSDPSPYSTWPSISSASLAGEQQDVRALNLTFPNMFIWHPPLFLFNFLKLYHFISVFIRGFAVTLLYGKINSEKQLEKWEQSYLPPTQIGILKVKKKERKIHNLSCTNYWWHLWSL